MSNKLEQIAIDRRNAILPTNIYNGSDDSNKYSATHSRALSDNQTPVHGKGNPNAPLGHGAGAGFYDIAGAVGGSQDINGSPNVVGSGRIANVTNNQYNFNNGYEHPDTSANLGQIHF